MKIGFVIDDSIDSSDGVQQYVHAVGTWLKGRGHQVHYLAGQSNEAPGVHSLAKNIRIKFNGNRFSVPLPASNKKIKALLAREHYDVLHVQMPYSPLLAGKIIKQASPSTAIVGTFHILPYGKFQTAGNRLLGKLQRRSLQAFDEMCFVSPAALVFAQRNYGISGQVIPNMIDVAAWKNRHKVVPRRTVFLGRLVPRKGCKELLLVLAALPMPLKTRLEIIIAGDGPQRQMLQSLARRLQLDASFYGRIAEADKKRLLASAELAVFPSLGGESFGIVLLEAMAAGAGVAVGGDNPGYRSVLGEVPNCLIDFKKTDEAAQKLTSLLSGGNERSALHTAQQKLIKSYDTAQVGVRIEEMYFSAIAKHAKRRDNEHYAAA